MKKKCVGLVVLKVWSQTTRNTINLGSCEKFKLLGPVGPVGQTLCGGSQKSVFEKKKKYPDL